MRHINTMTATAFAPCASVSFHQNTPLASSETAAHLGRSRAALRASFSNAVEFLHWLYVPHLSLLCIFDGQICCDCQVL